MSVRPHLFVIERSTDPGGGRISVSVASSNPGGDGATRSWVAEVTNQSQPMRLAVGSGFLTLWLELEIDPDLVIAEAIAEMTTAGQVLTRPLAFART